MASLKYAKMFQSTKPQIKTIKSIQVLEFDEIAALKIVLTLSDKETPINSSLPSWCLARENKQFISYYVDEVLSPALTGQNPLKQVTIDKMLDQLLANKSLEELEKVAKNVNWAVSVAVCKAGAHYKKKPAYMYLADLAVRQKKKFDSDCDKDFFEKDFIAPTPYLNVANGGLSSGNRLPDQHLVISNLMPRSFNHDIRVIKKVYDEYCKSRFVEIAAESATDDGDEMPYTPSSKGIGHCLKSLEKIIADHGLQEDVLLGVKIGASKFYEHEKKTYRLKLNEENGDTSGAGKMSAKALDKAYSTLSWEFESLLAFEDVFHIRDKDYSSKFTRGIYCHEEIVITEFDCDGFDKALRNDVCNCLHLKVGDIGSVTKSIGFVMCVRNEEWKVLMASHDSCETSEPFLADFCVGLSVEFMKIGVSCLTCACNVCNRVRDLELETAEEKWRRCRVQKKKAWLRNEGPLDQPCCDADVLEMEKKKYFKEWGLHGFE